MVRARRGERDGSRGAAADPGQGREAWFHTYYAWFASTLRQERYYTAAAIVAFLSLMVTAAFLCNALGRRQRGASLGAQVIGAGGLLWILGAVVSIGGHRAVSLMTSRGDPIETANSINWTVDTLNDAFELAGSALLGAGMLALPGQAKVRGRSGADGGATPKPWDSFCLPRPAPTPLRISIWLMRCFSLQGRYCCRSGSSGPADFCGAAKKGRSRRAACLVQFLLR